MTPRQVAVVYAGIGHSGICFYEGSPRKEHAEGSIVDNSFLVRSPIPEGICFFI